jgi:hypothetical protein
VPPPGGSAARKIGAAFLAGLLAGGGAVALLRARDEGGSVTLRNPLQVRLHRVEIRADGLGRYADWQRFLHDRHRDAVATLAREHMFVEAMFRDPAHDPRTLYWLEVRDDAGAHDNDSGQEIDREHERYMREVLRNDSWSVLDTENVLVAPFVQDAVARWQAREGRPGPPAHP